MAHLTPQKLSSKVKTKQKYMTYEQDVQNVFKKNQKTETYTQNQTNKRVKGGHE